ncbi:MAG: hypothetical protein HOI03_09745 [Candidatus Marinimicrobia bacterium]|nr:hypothetical protein [Candidatus Neomarinimicrobiota bacterium]
MGDLKNELKKYHINYDGEVNEEKFIDTLHNKINENKKNRTLKYSVSIFSLILILFNFMRPIETQEEKNHLKNFSDTEIGKYSEFLNYESDSLLVDSIYFQELVETIFVSGEIWETLEFFDEVNLIKEEQL